MKYLLCRRSGAINKADFLLHTAQFLSDYKNSQNHIVIGDFNIDLLDLNLISQKFLTIFLEKGFIPCFIKITRPSNSGVNDTCIDNMFIKTNFMNYNAYKTSLSFNDHYTLFLSFDHVYLNKSRDNDSKFNINYKKLRRVAKKSNWNDLLLGDPNLTTDLIIHEIHNCIRLSKIGSNKHKSKDTPRKNWITTAIIVSCNRKEFLYKEWKKQPSNSELKNEYTKYAKELEKVIKAAKDKFDEKQFEYNSKNRRNLRKHINDKIGNTKQNSCDIDY